MGHLPTDVRPPNPLVLYHQLFGGCVLLVWHPHHDHGSHAQEGYCQVSNELTFLLSPCLGVIATFSLLDLALEGWAAMLTLYLRNARGSCNIKTC